MSDPELEPVGLCECGQEAGPWVVDGTDRRIGIACRLRALADRRGAVPEVIVRKVAERLEEERGRA